MRNNDQLVKEAVIKGLTPCGCMEPLPDTLYPISVYKCDDCGSLHGTRPYACAVNWQCPNEMVRDAQYHEPAKQTYLGQLCCRCRGFIDSATELALIAMRNERQRAMWNKANQPQSLTPKPKHL
jgi:hypothetical protein